MTHKQKQKLARRKRTLVELQNNVPIFETEFWLFRGEKIRLQVLKTEENRRNKKGIKVNA